MEREAMEEYTSQLQEMEYELNQNNMKRLDDINDLINNFDY